jgi:hypothetical protein
MKRLVFLSGVVLAMTGCMNRPDAEGWRPSQKKAFAEILANDTYMSLCDAKPLYEKARRSGDSRLWSELLVRYSENLANGCIDIPSFQRKQKARKSDDFKTDYEIYLQRVSAGRILQELRNGKSIEAILKPYVPRYREFTRLIEAYKTHEKAGASAATLRKIRLNIERTKLLKPLEGDAYVLINIPEFKVRIVEKGKTKVAMRIVVGKRHMQTPIFGEKLQYIVLNPPWNVPTSIIRKEMLHKIIKNPKYLAAKGMEAHKTYDLSSPKVDLSAYDLRSYMIEKNATAYEKAHPKPLPFRIVQLPSKKNGLGRVKFLFPNKYSVYMHDTQSKYLFKRKYRAYSHGCVRLAEPNVMLRYLIEHYTDTSWEEALGMYNDMKTHYIKVTKPLPVHTAYFTAYVDDDGTLKFFDDIYGYDRIQKLRF